MSVIQKLRDQIDELNAQIDAIQEACTHPPVVLMCHVHERCITPEYDQLAKQMFRKTTQYTCKLCEKSWSEEEQY